MKQSILQFATEFKFNPIIENESNFKSSPPYVFAGMGGSALAPGVMFTYHPGHDIIVHRDYGLPQLSADDWSRATVILSSYSGDTEEALSAYDEAKKRGLNMVIIAAKGKLLDLARKNNLPYIQLPDSNISPRMALGYSVKALAKIINDDKALRLLGEVADELRPEELENDGSALAQEIKNRVPVVYASTRNKVIAYNWKIKLNETGKIPAFYNVLPEANHNEMNGFDVKESSAHLSDNFFLIFLHDANDDSRIQKRMKLMAQMYQDRHLAVRMLELKEDEVFLKIFKSLVLADWAAYYLAKEYGLDPEAVPMIEDFKKLLG